MNDEAGAVTEATLLEAMLFTVRVQYTTTQYPSHHSSMQKRPRHEVASLTTTNLLRLLAKQ